MSSGASRQRKGMWQKLKEKRAVERDHESNFKAGRINIQERNLHRTGIRGRKRYIYYAFLYLLGILCFINLVMLCIMLSVLRIDKSGMETLSLFKSSGLVRWMYGGDLQHVVLKTGEIGSFAARNLSIVGRNADARFAVAESGVSGSFAHFGPNSTHLQAVNGMRIVSTDVNKTVLHITDREVVWDVPAQTKNLDTTYVVSHRITSDHTDNLNIKGAENITVRGNENVKIDSRSLLLESGESIRLKIGKNSTMSFQAPRIHFSNIPVADNTSKASNVETFRLCICTTSKSKKLFKILATPGRGCEHAVSPCSA